MVLAAKLTEADRVALVNLPVSGYPCCVTRNVLWVMSTVSKSPRLARTSVFVKIVRSKAGIAPLETLILFTSQPL